MHLYQCIDYRQPTILVLDSGVGGLFVYNELQKIFPNFRYLYVFDNKYFPYGTKTEIFLINRLISIIEAMYKKYIFDLVIIACNTASVVSLKMLRIYFSFPIFGVTPNIELASKFTRNGVIGILATYRTVHYLNTINLVEHFGKYNQKVLLLGTSKLVELAESKIYGKQILKSELQNVFIDWLKLKNIPDTVVLGCTHFPILKEELKSILPIKTDFIDSQCQINSYVNFFWSKCFKKNRIVSNNDIALNHNIAYFTMDTALMARFRYLLLLQYNFFDLKLLLI